MNPLRRGSKSSRKIIVLALLLVFAAPVYGQAIQSVSCPAALSCSLPNVGSGHLLVAVVQATSWSRSVQITSAGEYWFALNTPDWYGNYTGLWYATARGGNETISANMPVNVILAEYPAAAFDFAGPPSMTCCGSTINLGPVGTTTNTGAQELVIAWGSQNQGQFHVFTQANVIPAGGNYSETVNFSAGVAQGSSLASFQLTTEPLAVVQHKNCSAASCAFNGNVRAGHLLLAVARPGCSANPCTASSITDSQGNVWRLAQTQPFDAFTLYYAQNARGGPDTISIPSSTNTIIAEYPPALGLQGGAYGTYNDDNLGDCINGQDCYIGWTHAIEVEQAHTLLVSWGTLNSIGPSPTTAGLGYKLIEDNGFISLEDAIADLPGVYISSMSWAAGGHWLQGFAAFRMN